MKQDAQADFRLQTILLAHECFSPISRRLQKIFAPQNRPFICYVILLAMVSALGAWFCSGAVNISVLFGSSAVHAGKIFGREFVAHHLPSAEGFWLLEAGMVGFFWLFTRPTELREYRWEKIGVSVVLVYLLLAGLSGPVSPTLVGRDKNILGFLSYLLPAAVFAGIWTPELVWHLARVFTVLLDPSSEYELSPSLRPAYQAARAGKFRRALRLTQTMLLNDFHHYEALVLVARLHRQLGRRWRARLALHRALRNPDLLDGQRVRIIGMLRELDAGVYAGWVIAGGINSTSRAR